jgi:SWI/SNF-related matrix-associated actin-dependent regulator 1 of chromatin subfamily A
VELPIKVLRDFQLETVEYAIKNPYAILALEMGLGKSLCALEVSDRLKAKTLVVCPAYLKTNWKREVEKWFPDKTVSIFNKGEEIYFPWDSEIVIISYELLAKAESLFAWADLVVADEAHFLKSITSKRSEIFHQFIYENSVSRCLLLTGTPLKNRVHEFYSLIAICNYNPLMIESAFLDRFPNYVNFANFFSYLNEYEIVVGYHKRKVQQWSGLKNAKELGNYLKNIYIRFEAADVLDLPPKVYNDILISETDNPELLEAFNSFNGENKSVKPDIKAKAALEKVPFTIKYAESLLESVDKVIIYSDHVLSCEAIAKHFGVTPITGKTTMDNRWVLADRFQNGDAKLIVATIGSFSTGITLTACHHIIFSDLPWVSGDLAQAEARIFRIGQNNTCFFHRLLGSYQDYQILSKLLEKSTVISEALNHK